MVYTVQLEIKNAALSGEILAVLKKDGDLRIVRQGSESHLDLIAYELETTDDAGIAKVEVLLKSNPASEVFLFSESAHPALLMILMRLGVKEFFPQPLNKGDLAEAIARFKERAAQSEKKTPRKSGRILSVIGSKGGVGATTVAVNTAVALARRKEKYSVSLLDMNTLFGDIPLFLDLRPKFHWGEITKNIERLDNMFLTNVLSRHGSGVQLLPSPAYLNGHLAPSPEIMERLLGVMRGMFDFVVVDGGQSMESATLRALQLSDQVLMVSLLSMPCLTTTSKLLKSFVDMGYVSKDRVRVIINRYMNKNEISVKDAEKGIENEIFWKIPNDYKTTMAAINQGKPISALAPKSKIAKSFEEMIEAILPEAEKRKEKKGRLFNF